MHYTHSHHTNTLFRTILVLSALSVIPCIHGRYIGIQQRSAGDDLVHTHHYYTGQFDNTCPKEYAHIGYKFQQSREGDRISNSLFDTTLLHFLGSNTPPDQRDKTQDIYADYFCLSRATDVSLAFAPRIQNNIVHFTAYLQLPEVCNGLYIHLNAPLEHSRWQLRASTDHCFYGPEILHQEIPSVPALDPGFRDYMFTTTLPDDTTDAHLYSKFKTVAPFTSLQDALSFPAIGVIKKADYGKFFGNDEDDLRLATVNVDLGLSAFDTECMHMGFYAKCAAPTGTKYNKKHAEYLFAPTIGDPYWKIGAGITGHYSMYLSEESALSVLWQGYITRWCHSHQTRSFDLKNNGNFSRYLTLKEFDSTKLPTGKVIRAIDYTTRRVKSHIDAQGEGIIEAVYANACGFSAGIGYNFYARAGEELTLCQKTSLPIDTTNWGIANILNTVQVMGFETTGTNASNETVNVESGPNANGVAFLCATNSDATLYDLGTTDNAHPYHIPATSDTAPDGYVYFTYISQTSPVDGDPVSQWEKYIPNISGIPLKIISVGDTDLHKDIAFTPQPVFLTINDIDLDSNTLPKMISHKFFGHAGIAWSDCCYAPYLQGGFEIECASNTDQHVINWWGVSLTGGLCY